MRLTFVIAAAILFGLAAYAKLLAMASGAPGPAYRPLQIQPVVHDIRGGADE
jgi:hypothetical protein